MKNAIEFIEDQKNDMQSWLKKPDSEKDSNTASYYTKVSAELDLVLERLRHKVKKDPRTDGLPPLDRLGRSGSVLIWSSYEHHTNPSIGFYDNMHGDFWFLQSPIKAALPTEEILFYADPNDII